MVYRHRKDWVLPFVRDRKVLDLGCVEHAAARSHDPDWLHGLIAQGAKSALGVDILEQDIAVLKAQGFNVVCANVETMALGDTFDVVIAGDLIEHLSNPGLFMDRVREHLTQGGRFLITTPNGVTFMRFLEQLVTGHVVTNPEHTCWYTASVLAEAARRSGFRIVDVAYVDDTYQWYEDRSRLWWGILALNRLVCRMRPQLSETLCLALQAS
jgi:2-polyprenyl-3-methyl-5-hydroxy-6-metoxy-1,4-benzoquinol methylase